MWINEWMASTSKVTVNKCFSWLISLKLCMEIVWKLKQRYSQGKLAKRLVQRRTFRVLTRTLAVLNIWTDVLMIDIRWNIVFPNLFYLDTWVSVVKSCVIAGPTFRCFVLRQRRLSICTRCCQLRANGRKWGKSKGREGKRRWLWAGLLCNERVLHADHHERIREATDCCHLPRLVDSLCVCGAESWHWTRSRSFDAICESPHH